MRDGDGIEGEMEDEGLVIRCRLMCRNAENLLLSEDVLEELNTNWNELKGRIENWMLSSSDHPQREYANQI